MPRRTARLLLLLALLLMLAAGGLLAFIYSGTYNVAATRQHTAPVYWLLMTTLRESIRAHAAHEAPQSPDLRDSALIRNGRALYDRHCLQCHGAPGVAPHAVGLGLEPPPPNLVLRARDLTAGELYWAVAKGLKMTGMPAWEFRLSERDLWALVAFLKTLPELTPSEYRAQGATVESRDGSAGERQ
jgi:mono/diheme cytochrome c family protein